MGLLSHVTAQATSPGVCVLVSDFDFDLPPELIAQTPPEPRGTSRLMVLDRSRSAPQVGSFAALTSELHPGDLLVVNDTLVFPARLLGHRVPSGGNVECLLLQRQGDDEWDALVHPGQKLRPGARMRFERRGAVIEAEVLTRHHFGRRRLRLSTLGEVDIGQAIDLVGHVPLPPYIRRDDEDADRHRYQTMFARAEGSVAAPTAGLHFTPDLMAALSQRGVDHVALTLHVGYGTFKPVRVERVDEHQVDAERYSISESVASRINAQLDRGGRVVAVGTTTARALESSALSGAGRVVPGAAETDLFIHPPFAFQVVGALITNFHLPRSSLLMLVSALAGRERLLDAYRLAVAERFRFYSYGDAMLVR